MAVVIFSHLDTFPLSILNYRKRYLDFKTPSLCSQNAKPERKNPQSFEVLKLGALGLSMNMCTATKST